LLPLYFPGYLRKSLSFSPNLPSDIGGIGFPERLFIVCFEFALDSVEGLEHAHNRKNMIVMIKILLRILSLPILFYELSFT
jgi:hypothetical protein